ncbi:MAG: M36 family metallopeptidase [Bacteroidota bacterium]
MNNQRYLFVLLWLWTLPLSAQSPSPTEKARQYLQQSAAKWALDTEDLSDLRVTDHYRSPNGIEHIYFQQYYGGLPIYQAIMGVSIGSDGQLYSPSTGRFHARVRSKIDAPRARWSASQALASVLPKDSPLPPLLEQRDPHRLRYAAGAVAAEDIPVRLEYFADRDGQLHLSWAIQLAAIDGQAWWSLHVDARDGQLLQRSNLTLSSSFTDHPYHRHGTTCSDGAAPQEAPNTTSLASSYRVFPFPGESPLHTNHELVNNPADSVASPFGWHDTDGQPGAEYQITRGNNVHAFPDPLSQNVSQGDEPNGGPDLQFDFPYDPNASVESYRDAATVNLFYAINTAHDFFYHYGFDEAAGNFQASNYSGEGQANDYILAQSQDGYLTGSVNNANFTAPPDGQSGRLQIFMWNRNVGGGLKYLQVLEPASVAGEYGSIASTDDPQGFGPELPSTPIIAEVVEVDDGNFNPYTTDACETIQNATELAGKIALVDRGGCTYERKVLVAEAAGAVAVIICNFREDPEGMQGTPDVDPLIPAVMIGSSDCQTIRQFVGSGLRVSLGQPVLNGPDFIDGDFDNGIIAHEYAHGVSTRLTGGPSQSECLSNPDFNGNNIADDTEQMGEGWSDFFALAMTTQAGDNGALPRGIGTFINRQDIDERGLRRYPYSTDLAINPLTYGDVAADPETHRLGSIWCAMLWDLYWALVEEYDFDPDLMRGSGGNNIAVNLVMEGLKMQACQPGFVDGRDAILAADDLLYGGANECLIWRVFARRGLGFYANQGNANDPGDQREDFEPLPTCIPALKIAKRVTPTVTGGELIDVVVTVTNHKSEAVSGVMVSEELMTGLDLQVNSANFPVTVQGDLALFELGEMAAQQEVELRYQLRTSDNLTSAQLLLLDCEGRSGWFTEEPEENNSNLWLNNSQQVYRGQSAWWVRSIAGESRQSAFMQFPFTVDGDQPVVRFFHSFRTERGQDAGIVQISTDEEAEDWRSLGDAFVRNGYSGPVNYLTFVTPNLFGFSGNSNGFQASYIDLRAYAGQDIRLRFNFATSDGNGLNAPGQGFWAFDEVEFLDLVNYDTEVVVTSNEGDRASARAGSLGTVVLGQKTALNEPTMVPVDLQVFPNPSNGKVTVTARSIGRTGADLSVVDALGRELQRESIALDNNGDQWTLDLSELARGVYFVKIETTQGVLVRKLLLEGE